VIAAAANTVYISSDSPSFGIDYRCRRGGMTDGWDGKSKQMVAGTPADSPSFVKSEVVVQASGPRV
jgi:hypothetical protein